MSSMPSASFASTPGWKSSGLTAAMISIRSVASAMAAAAVQVSSTANWSLLGLTMCSASRTDSKPAPSARRTTSRVREKRASTGSSGWVRAPQTP